MRLPGTPRPNADQQAYWNADEAAHWVAQLNRYDEMLQPFNYHVLGAAKVERTDSTLDIRCGCGATTLAAAQLAPDGLAIGGRFVASDDRGRDRPGTATHGRQRCVRPR